MLMLYPLIYIIDNNLDISTKASLTLFFRLRNNDLSGPEAGAALARSLGAMSSLREL